MPTQGPPSLANRKQGTLRRAESSGHTPTPPHTQPEKPSDDDDDLVAISQESRPVGKTFESSKVLFIWVVHLRGRHYRIDFTNSKMSGKKKVFVDGYLYHEAITRKSTPFKYSWQVERHLFSIVPGIGEGFELRIDGLPFSHFLRKSSRKIYASRHSDSFVQNSHSISGTAHDRSSLVKAHSQQLSGAPSDSNRKTIDRVETVDLLGLLPASPKGCSPSSLVFVTPEHNVALTPTEFASSSFDSFDMRFGGFELFATTPLPTEDWQDATAISSQPVCISEVFMF